MLAKQSHESEKTTKLRYYACQASSWRCKETVHACARMHSSFYIMHKIHAHDVTVFKNVIVVFFIFKNLQ